MRRKKGQNIQEGITPFVNELRLEQKKRKKGIIDGGKSGRWKNQKRSNKRTNVFRDRGSVKKPPRSVAHSIGFTETETKVNAKIHEGGRTRTQNRIAQGEKKNLTGRLQSSPAAKPRREEPRKGERVKQKRGERNLPQKHENGPGK